ncbi:MAG TPA: hypothetical protein VFJ58_20465 [Armatimonadota bacterium]|nr:hypothetical protein [Armatimonadota bacterium]
MYYDALGDRVGELETTPSTHQLDGGRSLSYAYDSKQQLLEEQSVPDPDGGNPYLPYNPYNTQYDFQFNYDQSGNSTTFRGSALGFSLDKQLAGTGYSFDGNGSPVTYQGSNLTSDPENRLTGITEMMSAAYNADGLRAWKTAGGATVNGHSKVIHFRPLRSDPPRASRKSHKGLCSYADAAAIVGAESVRRLTP